MKTRNFYTIMISAFIVVASSVIADECQWTLSPQRCCDFSNNGFLPCPILGGGEFAYVSCYGHPIANDLFLRLEDPFGQSYVGIAVPTPGTAFCIWYQAWCDYGCGLTPCCEHYSDIDHIGYTACDDYPSQGPYNCSHG